MEMMRDELRASLDQRHQRILISYEVESTLLIKQVLKPHKIQ